MNITGRAPSPITIETHHNNADDSQVISKYQMQRVESIQPKIRKVSRVGAMLESSSVEIGTGLFESVKKRMQLTKQTIDKEAHIDKLCDNDDLQQCEGGNPTANVEFKKQVIFVNDKAQNVKQRGAWFAPTNYIRSTKYTWWNFVPLNILGQFRRISNLYFLITMIITLIPTISPINPYTTILPLLLILCITMVKDGIEDLQRYASDRKSNNQPVLVIDPSGELKNICAHELTVGSIVRVDMDKNFPADLILISSSNPAGSCYVETANLDGETNLKTKRSVAHYQHVKNDHKQHSDLRARIEMELPNEHLDRFVGNMVETYDSAQQSAVHSLGIDHLLLRGSTLRNTLYVYGIVAYVGRETKLAKNMKHAKSKFSLLDKRLNVLLVTLLLAQQAACIVLFSLAAWFQDQVAYQSFYLRPVVNYYANVTSVISDWATYFILLNLVIPLSLFVSLEFVKMFQAKLMQADVQMTAVTDDGHTVGMTAKTSNLNQELSQLDIIFSDKTGTLTENKMEFCSLWCDGVFYHSDQDVTSCLSDNNLLHEYLMCVLLNHSSIPEGVGDDFKYSGPSADENALLMAAARVGYRVLDRTNGGLLVEVRGNKYFYEIVASLDFNSDRKRSSVIVKSEHDNRCVLYTKGADMVMFERSNKCNHDIVAALGDYCSKGLRTLVMASRELDRQELDQWLVQYHEANQSIQNRKYLVGRVSNQLERDLNVLGCSAIEDKLQDGVPESIDFLKRAGFQVWVLTGDKTDTAVNISYSANLLRKGETIEIRIQEPTSKAHCESKLRSALLFLDNNHSKLDLFEFALITDTRALKYALDGELCDLFLSLVSKCNAAICCRCTPLQKARVATLVETRLHKRGLAIGDGVNDVSMIQSCSVGIGIIGREGSQAARASDYAIPKFKHLVRLLAVHGHYSYVRNSDYLHTSFYKNMVIVYLQILFSIYNGFTGATVIDSWISSVFNTIFTVLPPLIIGVFEKDIAEDVLMSRPELYPMFKNDALFNVKSMFVWMMRPLWHACVIFFGTMLAGVYNGGLLGVGVQDGMWAMGTVISNALIATVLIRHCMEFKNWTVVTLLVMLVSAVSYVAFCVFYTALTYFFGYSLYYWEFYTALSSASAWLIAIVLTAICIVPDMAIKFVRRHLTPTAYEQVLLESYWGHKSSSRSDEKSAKVHNDVVVTEI
ncbi:phospholipid-transporting ATPase [Acrasis kona]|uniref:Phospholipid-transporting ATPase n=1 Tax=Acrasis kona TaxID=1008807 RepID=A0AAW2YT12_9EUKA